MLIVAFPSDLIPCPERLSGFTVPNVQNIFTRNLRLTSLPLSTDPMYELFFISKVYI